MAGGVWHPGDLPEGYHTAARGRSFAMSAADCVEVWPPGRRAVGLRQVDGMPHQLGHEGELRDNRAAHEHRTTGAARGRAAPGRRDAARARCGLAEQTRSEPPQRSSGPATDEHEHAARAALDGTTCQQSGACVRVWDEEVVRCHVGGVQTGY
jgi:hypothetical protein